MLPRILRLQDPHMTSPARNDLRTYTSARLRRLHRGDRLRQLTLRDRLLERERRLAGCDDEGKQRIVRRPIEQKRGVQALGLRAHIRRAHRCGLRRAIDKLLPQRLKTMRRALRRRSRTGRRRPAREQIEEGARPPLLRRFERFVIPLQPHQNRNQQIVRMTVSYTHLTLPTIYS